MANNLGGGVSRVLNPDGTEYVEVILQQGKPPMDAEFNLLQELGINYTRKAVLRGSPSGWLGNETNTSAVYVTDSKWSNWFKFGKQRSGEQKAVLWAAVNGWLVPVTGTRTGTPPGSPDDTDTWNKIALYPPPSNAGDFRIDFVFLEVWQARVPPNPSTLNKPSVSAIYRYGNVEGGYSFLPDDLVDPALGFETSQRVQLQYRIRVVKGLVGFTSYPDGFDPAVVKAKGAFDPSNPDTTTSFTFQNMRQVLGDPGLWRAGDGTANTLGTVDGYVYAIPIASVFRRNGIAWTGDPSQNLNGGFDRNPTAVDRTGVKTFSAAPVLAADMTDSGLTLSLVMPVGADLPMPMTPLNPVLIKVGDEYMSYQSITTGGTMTLVTGSRGSNGTRAEVHKAGTTVEIVSGRPDGLFSDQVAMTDLLDLRHVVNPGGFNYQTILEENLDKLLRGQLRSNWKRSGAGPQGPFVFYEDKITNGSVATGVTKLDGPDNIRTMFSDAACLQKIDLIVAPTSGAPPVAVNESWSLAQTVTQTTKVSAGGSFGPGDVLTVPVNNLKGGLPGGDADQVRWLVEDGPSPYVEIRIEGQTDPVGNTAYTVTPTNPGPNDDLVITLGGTFPTTQQRIYITVHCLYGPGRGLSRRPDLLHSVTVVSPNVDLLLNQQVDTANTFPTRVRGLNFWSKYRNSMSLGKLPTTAEVYAELGSKTVVVQPLRRIDLPDTLLTLDGTAANLRPTSITSGIGVASGSQVTNTSVNFVTAGVAVWDAVVLGTGTVQPGRYVVTSIVTSLNPNDTLILDRPVVAAPAVTYVVYKAQGLMPLLKKDGVTAKWTTTDPLGLFSGTTEIATATKNIYVALNRNLIPGWGEYDIPMLWDDQAPFSRGINYLMNILAGAAPFPASQRNYCPFSNGAFTYTSFSTLDLNPPYTLPAPYNTKVTAGGKDYAGIRKFTDTRGLGRQGLEFPPFYGLARVWAVYEANDYRANPSAFDPSTRAPTGSLSAAKNLLRQNCTEPLFWIELDDDGDSTFILNAACLDLTKSTVNPIANFAAGDYVVEASIFGFDRDAFDSSQSEVRIVLNRTRTEAVAGVRASNLNTPITSPELIVPAPLLNSDQILINFSRTPYQGDAWGSQTLYDDIGYKAGPLQSGEVVSLVSQQLDQSALTRPNQKVLEVVAELPFTTSLGTGRLAVDSFDAPINPTNVGFEDKISAWPPTSPVDPRPITLTGALSGNVDGIGTTYLGCTERLPLGALYRDKDFRGNVFKAGQAAGLVYQKNTYRNFLVSWTETSTYEQVNVPLESTQPVAGKGAYVVHVDGNQGNYSLLTNFRVNRGGSLFSASGPTPGGEVGDAYDTALATVSGAADSRVMVLVGKAYLVRNTVTNVGVTEVSAGNELMMLIQTTAYAVMSADPIMSPWYTVLSTNGTFECNSAADLYRIEGRPLENDYRKTTVDPSTITLTRRNTTTQVP